MIDKMISSTVMFTNNKLLDSKGKLANYFLCRNHIIFLTFLFCFVKFPFKFDLIKSTSESFYTSVETKQLCNTWELTAGRKRIQWLDSATNGSCWVLSRVQMFPRLLNVINTGVRKNTAEACYAHLCGVLLSVFTSLVSLAFYVRSSAFCYRS